MRRLYFLIPGIDSAKTIVDELLLARIEQRHMHIAAADHHALTEANLPEANLLQESDFVPAVERGLAIGGATGILAGVAAVALPGVGLVLGGGAILGIGLAGAGLGAWVSSMIGISAPSSRLTEFEEAIKEGNIPEATRRLENLSTRLLDIGQTELSQEAAAEARRIKKTHVFSEGARKNLKFGTRALLPEAVASSQE